MTVDARNAASERGVVALTLGDPPDQPRLTDTRSTTPRYWSAPPLLFAPM